MFLGYADELALSYAQLFAERILRHLRACGIPLARTTWQSDNGSEFVGSWQAKEDSAFTRAIEAVPGQKHRTIPPGQHRFQADVETVHALMETEFFEIEEFRNRPDFIARAKSYNLWFNLARRNSGKENQTPWELVRQKHPDAHPFLPLLTPVFLDELLVNQLQKSRSGGYDVWALPSFCGKMGSAPDIRRGRQRRRRRRRGPGRRCRDRASDGDSCGSCGNGESGSLASPMALTRSVRMRLKAEPGRW